MLSYIKSEFYRLLHHKWTYIFILICSCLLISENVVLAVTKAGESSFQYATTRFSLSMFYTHLNYIFVLCVVVTSIIFGNEHTNHTMKNSISYGISRGSIYFGKLIVIAAYSFIAFTIITGIHIGAAYLLLDNSGTLELVKLLHVFSVALPLFLFVLAASTCFLFSIENNGGGIVAIIGLVIVFPQISNLLGLKFEFFKELTKILPWSMMNNIGFVNNTSKLLLPWAGTAGYVNYWLFGIGQVLLFTAIGFMVFRKKEIK